MIIDETNNHNICICIYSFQICAMVNHCLLSRKCSPPPLIRDYCSNFRRNPDMRWMTIPHNPSRTMSFSDGTGWDTEEGPEFRWMKHFTNTHDTILIVSCCFLIN